jgi:pyruvate/2-oxoglutarate dehydrogenase complex dihydrolipoamide acyltransferase (E2) component
MTQVVLDPALWESVEAGPEGFIECWLAAEGDHVHAGQVLARANLIHTTVDVPAAHAGVLEEIIAPVGEKFSRGAVLARIVST